MKCQRESSQIELDFISNKLQNYYLGTKHSLYHVPSTNSQVSELHTISM